MTKTILALLAFLLIGFTNVNAQTEQKIIAEHFTNTLCSTCSFQNPKIKANIRSNPNVLHLTIHPSRPYSACILNKHNKQEQDDRTKFYGIYGSTPKLVINGELFTGNDYSSTSLFNDYKNKTTPLSIVIKQQRFGTDSIKFQIIVKAESDHSLGELSLFTAVVEDTIFYDAPNGEKEHYNVFRRTILGEVPTFTLGATKGDSMVFEGTVAAHTDWNFNRIGSMVMVQEVAGKGIVQSGHAPASQDDVIDNTVGAKEQERVEQEFRVYPNPMEGDALYVSEPGVYSLYSIDGALVAIQQAQQTINVEGLKPGVYFIRNEMGQAVKLIR
ncbi:MAG: T9SS type A sorting domain-containing protein [Bacteroidetes bacterium]|nr:T9SS type A sorting domain-containing protein [Bacteroidota bacterium]